MRVPITSKSVTLKSESLDLAIQFGFVVPLNGSAGAAGPGSSNTTTTANNTNSTGSVPVPPRGLCPPFFVPSVIFHGYCQYPSSSYAGEHRR